MSTDHDEAQTRARREFLTTCGKFAAITPIAVTGLLSVSKQNFAVAASGGGNGGGHANNGFGNGSGDGIPGKSGGKGKGPTGPITDTNR
jgi:hypothetical protein